MARLSDALPPAPGHTRRILLTALAVAAKLAALAMALALSGCLGFWVDSHSTVAPQRVVEECENSDEDTDDCMEARGYRYVYENMSKWYF
jgi:hypothetical protein